MGDEPKPADKPNPSVEGSTSDSIEPLARDRRRVEWFDGPISEFPRRRSAHVDPGESLLSEPTKRTKWKPSKAVIASNGKVGCILWATEGSLIEEMLVDGYSASDLAEIGLDDAPEGISIWEGGFRWIAGPWEHPDDGYLDPCGIYRTPTDLEWRAITAGRPPFEEIAEPPHGE